MKKDKQWTFNKQYTTSCNIVLQYVCRIDDNYIARRKIVLQSNSLDASIFGTDEEHDHIEKKGRG